MPEKMTFLFGFLVVLVAELGIVEAEIEEALRVCWCDVGGSVG